MLYLITGGSGSGKSEYAENKLCELSKKTKKSDRRMAIGLFWHAVRDSNP